MVHIIVQSRKKTEQHKKSAKRKIDEKKTFYTKKRRKNMYGIPRRILCVYTENEKKNIKILCVWLCTDPDDDGWKLAQMCF